MQLKSVVLPAPFEPSTARLSPGRTVKVTSISAASAPNKRVTPRNSKAFPAPTVERRCATLSTAAALRRRMALSAIAPARPKPDHPVRREENDREKPEADQEPEAIAVETHADQDVEREGFQDCVDQGADERTDRVADPADDRDDEDVDRRRDANR